MSVSGVNPTNTGFTFKPKTPVPPKAASAGDVLYAKITNSLADTEHKFLSMQAAELKKRVAFYQNFDGKIGNNAMGDIETQTANILARMSALGKGGQ